MKQTYEIGKKVKETFLLLFSQGSFTFLTNKKVSFTAFCNFGENIKKIYFIYKLSKFWRNLIFKNELFLTR